jgi:hypothetical protein
MATTPTRTRTRQPATRRPRKRVAAAGDGLPMQQLQADHDARLAHVPWAEVVRRLAEGASTAEVAQAFGCSAKDIVDHAALNPLHPVLLAEYRAKGSPTEGPRRLRTLRETLFVKLEHRVLDGDTRVMMWLADRLGILAATESETAAEEILRQLKNLTPAEKAELAELARPEPVEPDE